MRHLFKTEHAFSKIENKKISLVTACSEKDKSNKASVGKTKALKFYNDRKLAIDVNSEAIFSEELVENLVSVGKICDTDQTVVFDQYGYMVFQGKVSASGDRVYAQNRDPLTGLYPIVLTTERTGDCRAKILPEWKDLGTLGELENIYFTTVDELQQKCMHLSMWAYQVCSEGERTYTDEQKELDMLSVEKQNKFACANLARFYIKTE